MPFLVKKLRAETEAPAAEDTEDTEYTEATEAARVGATDAAPKAEGIGLAYSDSESSESE